MLGDAALELRGLGGICGENDVATGDKSFDVAETEVGEEGFEFGHGEAAFAEIHAAQERDVAEGGHRLSVEGEAGDDNEGSSTGPRYSSPYSIDLIGEASNAWDAT